ETNKGRGQQHASTVHDLGGGKLLKGNRLNQSVHRSCFLMLSCPRTGNCLSLCEAYTVTGKWERSLHTCSLPRSKRIMLSRLLQHPQIYQGFQRAGGRPDTSAPSA